MAVFPVAAPLEHPRIVRTGTDGYLVAAGTSGFRITGRNAAAAVPFAVGNLGKLALNGVLRHIGNKAARAVNALPIKAKTSRNVHSLRIKILLTKLNLLYRRMKIFATE